MNKQKPIFVFLIKWTLIFSLLFSLPFATGGDKYYSSFFYSFCTSNFTQSNVQWEHEPSGRKFKDITLKVTEIGGQGRMASNDFASSRDGLLPTVLIIALILATPMGFMRKLWMLLAGVVLIHLYIYLRMLLRISQWTAVTATGDFDTPYFWIFENNMGYRYLIPILLWGLLVIAFNFKALKKSKFSLVKLVNEGLEKEIETKKNAPKKKVRRRKVGK